MDTKPSLLEDCLKSSKQYAKLMNKYKFFFNHIFTNPLQAFGYERWSIDNIYFGLSNMPDIAKLFVETDAFKDQNIIVQPKNMASFCTFIYPDAKVHNHNYNAFRNGLEQYLQIRVSFCIIKRHFNYCEAFVWNFKKPNLSLLHEKQCIINDFVKNASLIKSCITQFKKNLAILLPQKIFSGINIQQHSPLYMHNINPAKSVGDYYKYIELSQYIYFLKRKNLTLDDFNLSEQEQNFLKTSLNTLDLSHATLEILNEITLKFAKKVGKRSIY